MDAARRYLAEEVAEDAAAGVLSRREALNRLALMGFTAVGASQLLAACGGDDDDGGSGTTTPAGSTQPPATTVAPLATEAIEFPGKGITLKAAWAEAPSPKGAVLVIHENQGLTDHIRSVTGRLAAAGYSALAVDLLSAEGGTEAVGSGAASAALGRLSARLVGDMRSSLDELQEREPHAKLGAVGFCFGGMQVWDLLREGEPRLAAAVPFYGPANAPDFAKSKAAVLAVYGATDDRVNSTIDAARAALQKAGLPHEFLVVEGAGHAFFNDTRPDRYHAAGAAQAWHALLDWFGRYLA